jgi:proline iminopeptidase
MSELAVVRHGRGQPVLVVHGGLGLDHTSMRALDRLGDAVELIYVDLPGNGRSPRPARWTDLTIETMVDELDALRTQLGIERWTVLGNSYGAMLALAYAIRHPASLAALISVGGAPSFAHAPAVLDTIDKRGQPDAAAALLAVLGRPARDDAHFAEVWMQVLPLYFHAWEPRYRDAFAQTRWSAAGYNRGNELLATFDLRAQLGSIAAPTLVVSGDDDFIMPAEICGEALARGIPNAQYAIIERAGHFPFLEQPAAFDAAVRDWLSRLRSR